MKKLAPSILSADFARLGEQVREAEMAGADWIHVDVMDGHFVPNITIGPPVVRALRAVTTLPLDVHLMIEGPERYLADFVQAGADVLTVHVETCPHLHRAVQQIKDLGVRAGSTARIARLRAMLDEIGSLAELEVDGGINVDTVAAVVEAGATVLVAGAAIFNERASVRENIRQLQSAIVT